MRTLDKIITNVDCSRGAPMGRMNVGSPVNKERVFDCQVPMCGAYDKGGAYWGLGTPMRVSYTKDLSYIRFYRQGA